MTTWTLIFLFMPIDDGLVIGWTKSYKTQAECQTNLSKAIAAEMELMRHPTRQTWMTARCMKK